MNYIYKGNTLNKVFESESIVKRATVLEHKKGSPYDGVVFCSRDYPSSSFLMRVNSSRLINRSKDILYRHELYCKYFIVRWECLRPSQWITSVRINPNVLEISAYGIVLLLSLIFDNLDSVYISSVDEKLDLLNLSVKEVGSSLLVPSTQKLDLTYLNEGTLYYGSRKGQQVKVYDKAKQKGINNKTLTRIEKTKKYPPNKRPSLKEFLQWTDSKAISSLVLLDISRIDKRTKLGKVINQYPTLKEAYQTMDNKLQRQLKNHPAFLNPLINLGDEFDSKLIQWKTVSHNSSIAV